VGLLAQVAVSYLMLSCDCDDARGIQRELA